MDKLMELVGRGDTHISTAAELARTIQSDFGTSSVGIRDLASCGADAKHESNTERDFWTWTKGAYKFHVEPYQIKLTLHASRFYWYSFGATQILDLPALLASQLLLLCVAVPFR